MSEWRKTTFEGIINDLNHAITTLQAQFPPPERLFTPDGDVIEVPKAEQERIKNERKKALRRIHKVHRGFCL